MATRTDKAGWIWIAREQHAEDCYLRARRTFRLTGRPARAVLRVAAFSEYVLYVNGQYVGCGPTPSSPPTALADVYTEADLPLKRGTNVLAVLAHNDHVGTPRRPRLPGGLWLDLEVTGARGRTQRIVTDRGWRVARAEDFSGRAPRLHWTAGFAEVRDTRREPPAWTEARFRDRRWARADVVRPWAADGLPAPQVRDRPTPRLVERLVRPARVASAGKVAWTPGPTAIPFEFTVMDRAHGEFYAGTFVHAPEKRKVRLVFDCDEAASVYVNNRQVLRQGYSEAFVHWLDDAEHDDYTNIHRGQGRRVEAATLTLAAGWNSLGVVIYDPGSAWGFALRFEDAVTGDGLPLDFSPDLKAGEMAHWHIVVEQLCPCGKGTLPDTPGPNGRTFPDPAQQLAWETRTARRPPRAAASLVASSRGRSVPALRDGETVVYDFGEPLVGYVELEVEGPVGALLDLAWAEGLGEGGRVDAVRGGMRCVDRLILRGGRQTVRLVNRRTLRYLELVSRPGEGCVKVHRLGVWALGREDAATAALETDDPPLAAALALSERTARCCLLRTLEGTPGREAEQGVAAAFLLAQAERVLYGRTDLGEAALRAFAADQRPDGRFRSIVPSGTAHTVPDWNLLWVIWLEDHVRWTGDLALAADLYPAAVRCLAWTAARRGPSGLLVNRDDGPPWWLFLDASPMDKRGEVTAWQALYVRALRAEAALAQVLGRDDDAAGARAEADAVARAAQARLWGEARGRFVDARLYDHLSDAASTATNYYALYGGLATAEQADRILGRLWKNDRTESASWGPRENPYVKYFALEALLERGQAGRALAMIRAYWGAMAEAGLATVPEVFPQPQEQALPARGLGKEGPYGGDPPPALCHGWGVSPAALVARWILGVHPEGPGFDPLRLAPMPGDLKRVCGRVWTPRGTVEVAVEPSRPGRRVRVTVPEGMAYRLDRGHLGASDQVEVTGGRAVG